MLQPLKFALMIYPVGFQGKIWQTVLRSQNIAVIWESGDVNLIKSLQQLQQNALSLPDLILIDTRLQSLRPYAICRWCRKHCPALKIVLVNGAQYEVLSSERQWAICQGAADLLPRFPTSNLISNTVAHTSEILDLLELPSLNHSALVSALLKLRTSHQPKA
ncbi:MAG: response regulator, partial [Leptolyngbyaceae cyanobacterium SL_1_1]|nr:response regulator [Leptolyngbyaceae cyanobacterium SL_1_1]